jgi:hypothetical protein
VDENHWSDRTLREFVRTIHEYDPCCDGVNDDESAKRVRFRREVQRRLAPVVQARLLEKVGTVTDPEGIAIVAGEIIENYCNDDERRWLLVCPEPWVYLGEWIANDIAKAYKGASGARRSDTKALKQLEKAARSEQ